MEFRYRLCIGCLEMVFWIDKISFITDWIQDVENGLLRDRFEDRRVAVLEVILDLNWIEGAEKLKDSIEYEI